MLYGKWLQPEEDLTDAFQLRREIFIEEQNIPEYLEFTGDDSEYKHLIIYEEGTSQATGRMRFTDAQTAHFGRICVRKQRRGAHLGEFLVKIMMEKAFQEGALIAEIDAQEQAARFYEKLGFVRTGPVDEPSGIPHCRMQADLISLHAPKCEKMSEK